MSSASMQTVKAGWIQRQSEVFKRWKKQYCVLYLDGGFSYFSDETRRSSEGSLHLPTSLNFIKVGVEVLKATAPSDHTINCLLELQTAAGSLFFCTDSGDDAEAWKAAMVEVKNMNVRGRTNASQQSPGVGVHLPPPPYAPQPPQVPQIKPTQPQPAYAPPTQPPATQPPAAWPPAAQPQAPPAYYTQQGSAPPPAYYTPNQQVVTTTVYPRRQRRNCYPRQTTVCTYPAQTYYGLGGANTTVYQTNGQTSTMYQNPYQQGQSGQTTVIVEENRNRNGGAGTGFVAGAAVGGLMMAPLLFW